MKAQARLRAEKLLLCALSLRGAPFASLEFPHTLSKLSSYQLTYQLLDQTGKEPAYLQLQLQYVTTSSQRYPLCYYLVFSAQRYMLNMHNRHYYFFFIPVRRLFAKILWPGKVVLVI